MHGTASILAIFLNRKDCLSINDRWRNSSKCSSRPLANIAQPIDTLLAPSYERKLLVRIVCYLYTVPDKCTLRIRNLHASEYRNPAGLVVVGDRSKEETEVWRTRCAQNVPARYCIRWDTVPCNNWLNKHPGINATQSHSGERRGQKAVCNPEICL